VRVHTAVLSKDSAYSVVLSMVFPCKSELICIWCITFLLVVNFPFSALSGNRLPLEKQMLHTSLFFVLDPGPGPGPGGLIQLSSSFYVTACIIYFVGIAECGVSLSVAPEDRSVARHCFVMYCGNTPYDVLIQVVGQRFFADCSS
jgi:hypothetical protein